MSKATGDKGEEIAADYLRKKGYEIVAVNWQFGHLELDIITKKDDKLVIVEVKTGNSVSFGEPHEWVTRKKQMRVIKAADAFVMQNNIQTETQFDIVGILLSKNHPPVINHMEDAFSALG